MSSNFSIKTGDKRVILDFEQLQVDFQRDMKDKYFNNYYFLIMKFRKKILTIHCD